MKCRSVRLNLVPFIEGALEENQTRQVLDHLAECPSCLRENRRLQGVVALFSQLRLAEAGVDPLTLIEGIRERLDGRGEGRP